MIEVIAEKILKPLLAGMDPTQIEEIWDKAYVRGGHKEFGTRGIGVVALSGVDIALWDIVGKARGVPLYKLLGGKCRDKVPVYATALYPEEPSKVAKKARAFAEQGFRGVKIKVGFDLDQDVRIVRAVREELGKEFVVMTDANQGYTVDVALKAAGAFADCGAFWLEEPLFVEDIAGHARLRAEAKVPIAVGENLHTCYAFENFVLRGAVDFLQPDVARAGGMTEIRRIAALTSAHGVRLAPHAWGSGVLFAASIHVAMAAPNCHILEVSQGYMPMMWELFNEPFDIRPDGMVHAPDRPGLGFTLRADALERFRYVDGPEYKF